MAYKVRITYLDGQVEEFMPNPRARIDTERHFGGFGEANVQEATIYMAWTHLQKAGKTAAEFDAWLDTLADFEEVRVGDVRPTPPAQPDASLSD